MRKRDLNYDKMLNVAKVVMQDYDQHHWLIHYDMENMKDHDAYQDQRKKQENTMDMDQQMIKFHVHLA
jgi:hypothetical protein